MEKEPSQNPPIRRLVVFIGSVTQQEVDSTKS